MRSRAQLVVPASLLAALLVLLVVAQTRDSGRSSHAAHHTSSARDIVPIQARGAARSGASAGIRSSSSPPPPTSALPLSPTASTPPPLLPLFPNTSTAFAPIPQRIFQTWKSRELPPLVAGNVEGWQRMNPGFRHELYTDRQVERLIRRDFPSLVYAYEHMRAIERADLFRYAVLFKYGGVYADVDVECVRPVPEWTANVRNYDNVDFIAGFEVITGKRPDWRQFYARKHQLSQWTIASRPRHPALGLVLARIRQYFDSRSPAELLNTTATRDVMDTTGPGIWSDAVEDYLQRSYNLTFGVPPLKPHSLRDNFFHIGNTLLLPMRSFGLGSSGYQLDSARHSPDDIYVEHHFLGSWKHHVHGIGG